jgi:hypothetical protein
LVTFPDTECVPTAGLTVRVFVSLADRSSVPGVLVKLRLPVLPLTERVKEVELKRRDRDIVWCSVVAVTVRDSERDRAMFVADQDQDSEYVGEARRSSVAVCEDVELSVRVSVAVSAGDSVCDMDRSAVAVDV